MISIAVNDLVFFYYKKNIFLLKLFNLEALKKQLYTGVDMVAILNALSSQDLKRH